MELVLVPDSKHNFNNFNRYGPSIAVLDYVESRDRLGPIGIQMQCLSRSKGEEFARIPPDTLFTVTPENRTRKGVTPPARVIHVRQRSEAKFYLPVYDSKSPIVLSSTSFSLCGVHPI